MSVEELSERGLSAEECQENTDTGDVSLAVEIGEQSIEPDDEDDEIVDEEDELEKDDIVREVVSAVAINQTDFEIEPTVSDLCENRLVCEFAEKGCGCALLKGQQCSQQFSTDYIADIRSHCASLSRDELDMAILGQIMANSNFSSSIVKQSRHSCMQRQKNYSKYMHGGQQICRIMFRFFHTIGKTRLENLKANFREHGITARIHGNTNRLPHNALSLSSVEYVVRFLLNYADQNAILLPGRIPGYQKTDIKLLPSSLSKRNIWQLYFDSAQSVDHVHSIAYSTFNKLWHSLLPSIILMKPMSDLCWTCQQNSTAIVRAANKPDSDKSDTIVVAQEHLFLVQLERSYYKTTCDTCRQQIHDLFCCSNGTFSPPLPHCNTRPNSKDIAAHYSFDYAQQVHFPSDPLQPGPIFFLTPRKCNIFGVHCEGIPRQINFLTDEAADCGKGSNVVISQLHYFFQHHGLGEKEVFLHCDNCTGQNKNSFMIQYLLWRCTTGLHSKITLSFLVVGHTKFAPDWCFGLLKRKFRRTKLSSIGEIAQVVDRSALCNISQLVSTEDGNIIVPTLNWSDFFAIHLKKLPAIKKYHHFHFDSSLPGIVSVKEHSNTESLSISLLKQEWIPDIEKLPSVVPPKVMSAERQWYLYNMIRPYCSDTFKDVTCPLPGVPRVSSRTNTPIPQSPPSSSIAPEFCCSPECVAPTSKRQRLCGLCKNPGHNSRSCPHK